MSDQQVFRRFSPDRQEQIRQLLTYVQLLGLSGQDLVSIGQTVTRTALAADLKPKRIIARDLATQARRSRPDRPITFSFEWTGPTGQVHVFNRHGLATDQVQMLSYSDATKTKLLNRPRARLPGVPTGKLIQLVIYLPGHSRRTWTYNVLLNIHYGDIAV